MSENANKSWLDSKAYSPILYGFVPGLSLASKLILHIPQWGIISIVLAMLALGIFYAYKRPPKVILSKHFGIGAALILAAIILLAGGSITDFADTITGSIGPSAQDSIFYFLAFGYFVAGGLFIILGLLKLSVINARLPQNFPPVRWIGETLELKDLVDFGEGRLGMEILIGAALVAKFGL